MKVSIAAAISLDGKLTRHKENTIREWVSDEDQKHFHSLIAEHDSLVMGRTTYEVNKSSQKLSPDKLRIVLTTHVDEFIEDTVPGQLEFFNYSVEEIVDLLEQRGYKNLLVVGGSRMINDFLSARLADKLYITVEPYIFGSGKPLVSDTALDAELKLVESKKLNDKGTMLLIYTIQ